MTRRDMLNLCVARPSMIAALFVAGGLMALMGVRTIMAVFPTINVWSVVDVAMGVWLILNGWSALRVYRRNRTWLEAAKTFRAAVSKMSCPPTLYVNDDKEVAFLRLRSGHLLLRSDFLLRTSVLNIDAVHRALEDGGKTPFVYEEFEVRSIMAVVTRSVQGENIRFDEDGELECADGEPKKVPLLRGMRSRREALANGLLQANELELNEVLAQLAGARPINTEAGDSE